MFLHFLVKHKWWKIDHFNSDIALRETCKTHWNYHLVTYKLAYIHKTSILCTNQNHQEMEQHSAICYTQNQHLPSLSWFQLATPHVNNGSLSLASIEWKPMDRQYYWDILQLKNVSCYQTQCSRNYFIFLGKQHIISLGMQHCPTVATKSLNLLLLIAPPQQSSPKPHWLQDLKDLYCSISISLNKQAAIGRSLGKQYTAFKWKYYFCVTVFYQVVQEHYLGEVKK